MNCKSITLENSSYYLTDEEFEILQSKLNNVDIRLVSFFNPHHKALYGDIMINFNKALTEYIRVNFMDESLINSIENFLNYILEKISIREKRINKLGPQEPVLYIKIENSSSEAHIPILPYSWTKSTLTCKTLLKSISESNNLMLGEPIVIDIDFPSHSVEIKSISTYANEQKFKLSQHK
ncbi:MAG: hypothetical protein RSB66_08360 [Clostridium sp.]